ncbi:MAG: hypothetical protein K2Y10_03585 [Burkholderiaceae bacterium]|nr:hypothetical protein [Burkholderiaceae bacterium]
MPSVVASLELVVLNAGGYCIACPSDQVAAMVATPASEPWCSLESLLGLDDLEPVNGATRQYLKIYRGQKQVLISLLSPPHMVTLDATAVYPLPVLVRQHCRLPGLVALGSLHQGWSQGADQWLLIFDFRHL